MDETSICMHARFGKIRRVIKTCALGHKLGSGRYFSHGKLVVGALCWFYAFLCSILHWALSEIGYQN